MDWSELLSKNMSNRLLIGDLFVLKERNEEIRPPQASIDCQFESLRYLVFIYSFNHIFPIHVYIIEILRC